MRYFFIIAFVLLTSFGAPILVSADTQIPPANNSVTQTPPVNTGNTGTKITLINPLEGVDCSGGNGDCLMAFLNSILDFVIQIGSIVIIFMLVYIGFLFVYYSHTPGKVQEARKALLWTVIGALILLGAKAISLGIQATVQALSTGG